MKSAELSIIIVSFNTKELLRKCLNSVYKSKYSNFEVIVVDNNSADHSDEMVRTLHPKTLLIVNSKNRYLSSAINQALKNINGKFFLILNSDTAFKPDTLKKMVELMKANSQIGIATCKHLKDDGSVDKICSRFPNPIIDFLELTLIGQILIKYLNISKFKIGRASCRERV